MELSSGWDSARSPYHLRNKWACLRRSVPSYHNKTFQGKAEQCTKSLIVCHGTSLAQQRFNTLIGYNDIVLSLSIPFREH